MVAHDRLRAAELAQSGETERRRTRGALRIPEPLHDELQEGRLDTCVTLRLLDRPAPGQPDVELSRRGLVKHGLDEARLDRERLRRLDEVVPAVDGADDRPAAASAVELVEPQVVSEQVRDPPLERVEPRECILSGREQDVDANVAA